MRNKLPKRLRDAGMSLERYMALKWACREYDRMRIAVADMRDPLRASGGRTRDAGGPGDPTGRAVERLLRSREYKTVCAIEQAAVATCPAAHRAILDNVCRGKSWEIIHPPYGKNQFYAMCVEFFLNLDGLL